MYAGAGNQQHLADKCAVYSRAGRERVEGRKGGREKYSSTLAEGLTETKTVRYRGTAGQFTATSTDALPPAALIGPAKRVPFIAIVATRESLLL